MVPSDGETTERGTRPGAEPLGGSEDAPAQTLSGCPSEPVQDSDDEARKRDQGVKRSASQAFGREHSGGDERQNSQESRYQGGEAQRKTAEQYQEIYGGA